jgi:hypothetical protein
MHQTTVRFSPDLWVALEEECARLGISAAQYVREAALARLSYTAGRRADAAYALALADAGVPAGADPRQESADQVLAIAAVSAQSDQVRRRAREVREQAAELRRRRREMT